MGISMAGFDAFDYNRFDELDKLYRSLYEEKKEEDEDDVSPKEKKAIGDAVEKHTKNKHEDDDDSDEDDKEKDDEEDDSEDDDEDKRDPKKMKIKGKLPKGTVKEEVITYLMDNGFVNNEVSAEVMAEHMNPEWMEAILEEVESHSKKSPEACLEASAWLDTDNEGARQKKKEKDPKAEKEQKNFRAWKKAKSVKEETTKFDERGRPKSGPYNVYQKGQTKRDSGFDAALKRVDAANKAKTPEQRKKELDAYKERQANR